MALYLQYQTTTTGDITFIGNTIELSKEFDSAYTKSNRAPNYPNNITESINTNFSKATLILPKNSTIESAYLIWGGTFTEKSESHNKSFLENGAYLQFPTNNPTASSINYKTKEIYPSGKEIYTKPETTSDHLYTFYTNWANVTNYVKYPGTFKFSYSINDSTPLNCCGWILAVLYKNLFLPARNFSLYIGIDSVNTKNPVNINTINFTTPVYTPPKGNLLMATLYNKAEIKDNEILFGSNKTNLIPLSDNKNPDISNITAYKNKNINNKPNLIMNHQGIDIKSIDTSPALTNNQTSANIRFTTKKDPYFINVVSNQVTVDEPVFTTSTITTDKKYVSVGNEINFTINIINTGNVLAENLSITDILPEGFSFVPDSLEIDSIPNPADITTKVPLKNLGHNETTTVTFYAHVDRPPIGDGYIYTNQATINYSFNSGVQVLNKSFQFPENHVYSKSIAILPLFSKSAVSNNTIEKVVAIGNTVDYTINIVNLHSSSDITNAIIKDTLPKGLTYIPNSLYINNNNSNNDLSSIQISSIPHNTTSTIRFSAKVTDTPASNSEYINSADIHYNFQIYNGDTLSNDMSTSNTIYSDSIVIIPDVDKTAVSSNTNPNVAAIKDTIDYTITVTNPSDSNNIQDVILNDTLPNGLTYKPDSLYINDNPSLDDLSSINLNTIDPGNTTTVKFTVNVVGPPDDFKYVNSAVINYKFLAPDGTALSNNISVTNTVYSDSVVVKPTMTKTAISNNSESNTAAIGDTIDYTITINNTSSNANILNATLNDTLPQGLTYQANSLYINNAPSLENLSSINLNTIAHGDTKIVKFKVKVTDNPSRDSKYVNSAILSYNFLTPDNNTLSNTATITNTIYSNSIVITPTITKTSTSSNSVPNTAAIGDTIKYTITINNTSDTKSIIDPTLVDILPTELTYKTNSLYINGVSSSDNLSAIPLKNILPNSITTVEFDATVAENPHTDSKYTNTATLNYEFLTSDGNTLRNNVSTDNTIYSNSVVITPTISKTAVSSNPTPNTASVGDTINYTITITNPSATNTILNPILSDTLPLGLAYNINSLLVNGNPSPDNLSSIDLGNINPKSTTVVKFSANVIENPINDYKYINSATVNYNFLAPDGHTLHNNVSTSNTIYSGSIVVKPIINKTSITSNSILDTAAIGDTIDYTITITNPSNTTIENPILNDNLPTGLTYKSNSLTINGLISSNSLSSIDLDDITPNSTTTIKFTVKVTSDSITDSKYINSATLNYEFLTPDNNRLHNSISTNNIVYSSSIVVTPTFIKTAISSNTYPNVVGLGDTVDYTITITNPSNTTTILNAIINDTLPTGLIYKAGSLSINGVSSSDTLNSINLRNISPNATTTVKFTANVISDPISDSRYINSATLNYDFLTFDNTTLHNSISTNNTIYFNSIIIIPNMIKVADTKIASIGDTVNYTITIENNDNLTPIINTVLTDTLPDGLSFKLGSLKINNTANNGSPITGVSIGDINPNTTTTINFSAIVNEKPSNGNDYINSAKLAYQFNTPDGNLSNTITATNTLYSSDIASKPNIIKTSNPRFAKIGDTVKYTITFTNTSPILNIGSANIKDILPPELNYNTDSLTINGVPSSNSIISGINITNLLPNSNIIINYTATVTASPSANSKYINSVNASYSFLFNDGSNFNGNVTTTNNLYPDTIIIKPSIILSIDKNTVFIGDTINFSIVVTNTNNSTIENPILTDVLENGLEYIPSTLAIDGIPSSYSLTTGVSLPNMPQNSSHTITFSAKVISYPNTGIQYINFATLDYNFKSPIGNLFNSINSNTVTINLNEITTNPLSLKKYIYKTDKNASLKETLLVTYINNSPISFTLIDAPTNGFTVINESGTFKYTPKVNFVGLDSFTVSVTNALGGSSIITVDILVEDFNLSLNYMINCKK